MNQSNLHHEIQKAIEPLQKTINTLIAELEKVSVQPVNNVDQHITKEQLEALYGIKISTQAKLRMDKENGLPYVRPAGSRIILYPVTAVNEWMQEWRAA